MPALINGYEIIIASDVNNREGIGIEVWQDNECLLEIFRNDAITQCTVTLFKTELPLELIVASIEYFKKEIPQYFAD